MMRSAQAMLWVAISLRRVLNTKAKVSTGGIPTHKQQNSSGTVSIKACPIQECTCQNWAIFGAYKFSLFPQKITKCLLHNG
jgi:hypothetical protein